LPLGKVDYNTLAQNTESETVFFDFTINSTLLKKGKNTIAIEVHQASVTSSDISLDFEMNGKRFGDSSQILILNNEISDTLLGSSKFDIFYKPITKVYSNEIVINEVSPNNSIFEDEAGQKDDWVELYNNGQDTIDLATLYFTDDTANLSKAILSNKNPDSTLIYPNEYKVLWADGQIAQGALHLNIKLNKNGDYLGIYQPVGNQRILIDEVQIADVPSKKTYARFPNITGDFTLLNHGTPWVENVALPEDPVIITELTFENSSIGSITYHSISKLLEVKLENNTPAIFVICDMSGRVIVSKTIFESATFNLQNQMTGIYMVKVISKNKAITEKLMVK
jgi:hypothetical protein